MNTTGLFPGVQVEVAPSAAVGQAGGALLTETIRATGLDQALSVALAPWRRPMAQHDPGKIFLDLALTLAVGGDCLADVASVRAEPDVYGQVALDPTISRLLALLASDVDTAERAIDTARRRAREAAWARAGQQAPNHRVTAKNPLVIDLDATLVTSHKRRRTRARRSRRGSASTPARLRRPRPRRWWGDADLPAAPKECGLEHGC